MNDQHAEQPSRTRSPSELGPQGRRTRQRLLDAARQVLREQGYHGARVDDIVSLAGTSHGTFYLYFANIEAVLSILFEECGDAIRELAERLPTLRPGNEGRTALRDWIARFDDVCLQQSPVMAAHLESTRGKDRDPFAVYKDLQARLAAAIADAGVDVDADVAAMALIAMVDRFSFFSPQTERNDGGRAAALDTVTRLAQAGLFP